MDIKELQKNWDGLAKQDPLRAISGDKGFDWDLDVFFETGVKEVELLMDTVNSLNHDFPRRKALDFGCGVGRLSQPLSEHFEEVHGIDISKAMIELANKYNKHGDKCEFHLNATGNLSIFDDNSFDLIYTILVLQHMKPIYAKKYIQEFLRILNPQGMLVFQMPSKLISGEQKLSSLEKIVRRLQAITPSILWVLYRKIKGILFFRPKMEMYGIKHKELIDFLENNEGVVLKDLKRQAGGWDSYIYYVTKKEK